METWSHATILIFAIGLSMAILSQAQSRPWDYLHAHNVARLEVGLGPMKWNKTLEAYARRFANQRAGDCELIESGGPYGENMYEGSGPEGYTDGVDAVRLWYEEKPYYDHGSNRCVGGQECGHYTQMVWRDSVRLGCARVKCAGGDYFVVCNYDPPGNYEGERPY